MAAADLHPDGREHGYLRDVITGWGRTAPTASESIDLTDAADLGPAVKLAGPRGVLARGLGRSYGDASLNAGGLTVNGRAAVGLIDFDAGNSLVTVQAGTSIDDLLKWIVPLGWFVPVTPGTRQVTIGGAIAADIHGKNHHRSGSFCSHVASMRLVTGDGSLVDISPESDPDLFWATAGGMGLTGIITDATIHLVRIPSSRLAVDTDRTTDLDQVMGLMVDDDDKYEFSVAWIDLTTHRGRSGRSVLTRGNFATVDQLDSKQRSRPFHYSSGRTVAMPPMPRGLLRHSSISTFNSLWFHKAPRRRREEIQRIGQFFHPLDLVSEWNRLYGAPGFIQWQMAVPDSGARLVRRTIEQLEAHGYVSFLALLKRFGPGDPGHLSFPIDGWTLAMDLPVQPGLGPVLDRLDEMVAEAGGRIYLAKDSRMRPEMLPQMYSRLDAWREVRDRVDPEHHFQSDLARRLHLA